MYKSICIVAVLVAALAFMSGSRSADASPVTPIGPVLVAHDKLLDQTAPIPTTTIFTPSRTGLYRLSAYATTTVAIQTSNFQWQLNVNWSDDAGAEYSPAFLVWNNSSIPPYAYGDNNGGWPGNVLTFEALAGVPFSYSVNGTQDGSKWSLYYTLERLE